MTIHDILQNWDKSFRLLNDLEERVLNASDQKCRDSFETVVAQINTPELIINQWVPEKYLTDSKFAAAQFQKFKTLVCRADEDFSKFIELFKNKEQLADPAIFTKLSKELRMQIILNTLKLLDKTEVRYQIYGYNVLEPIALELIENFKFDFSHQDLVRLFNGTLNNWRYSIAYLILDNIKNESLKVELLLNSAVNMQPYLLEELVKHCNFKNQNDIITIVNHLLAAKLPEHAAILIKYIDSFETRLEVVKRLNLKKEADANIKIFLDLLKGPDNLFRILDLILLKNHFYGLIKILTELKIEDPKLINEILIKSFPILIDSKRSKSDQIWCNGATQLGPLLDYCTLDAAQIAAWDAVIEKGIISLFEGRPNQLLENSIRSALSKMTNLRLKVERLVWLATYLGHALQEDCISSIFEETSLVPVIVEAFKLTHSRFDYLIEATLNKIYKDKKKAEAWFKLTTKLPHRLLIPALFLMNYHDNGHFYRWGCDIYPEDLRRILESLSTNRFDDRVRLQSAVELISALREECFTLEHKIHLLKLVLIDLKKGERESAKVFNQKLGAHRKAQDLARLSISAFLSFGEKQLLRGIKTVEEINANWREFAKHTFGLQTEEDDRKFIEIFCDSKRYPNGLTTYAARRAEHASALQTHIKALIRAVIDDKFSAARNSLDNNLHLRTIAEKYPDLLEKWVKPVEIKIGKLQEASQETPQQLVSKYIKQAIADRHMGEMFTLYKLEGNELDAENYPIESLCLELISKNLSIDEMHTKLYELKRLVSPKWEFAKDIEDILSRLAPKMTIDIKDLLIKDTDEWEDLFLLGTEVLNSCQHIAAAATTSVCSVTSRWQKSRHRRQK